MKKFKKKRRKIRKCSTRRQNSKKLRSGSKHIKKQLLEKHPFCDICGSPKSLQLHHIYLIRHGFATKLERCTLLCPVCHKDFHQRWDKYLDLTFRENPDTDFLAIYNTLKKL